MVRFTAFLLCLFGCAALAPAAEPPLVVTTNTILNDFVRAVAGNRVRTLCLVRPGLDIHSYEPAPAEVRALSAASLVVENGLGLETWVAKLVANSGYRGPVLVATAGIVPLTYGNDADGLLPAASAEPARGAEDPHAWQDPRLAARYVENIRDALIRLLPSDAGGLRANAAAYLAQLRALDTWARAQLAAVPPARRKLVTTHDSLAYFARAYGFEIVPLALSPSHEPTARHVAALIDFIRAQRVPAVFFEPTTNPKVLELIAREAGVRAAAELYTDSTGPAGSPAATYLGLFRLNVERIAAALR